MTLILCPECGHEVSTTAAACPNCASPLRPPPPPISESKVLLTKPPPSEGFPTWALIPIGLLAVILIFVLYIAFNRNADETASDRINVNVNTSRSTASRTSIPSDPVSAPPSSHIEPIPSSQSSVPGSQTSVAEPPTKGMVNIEAKMVARSGSPQAVKNEKFYLLDQDVESILSSAGLAPIQGQNLSGSLGLSLVFPDKYREFRRDALAAINKHIKYSGQTDSAGKAQISGVEPNSYYLFGLAKAGRSFAVWNYPVSIQVGDNLLNLSPQQLTEINEPNG